MPVRRRAEQITRDARIASRVAPLNRSTDWQSAISRIGNPQPVRRFLRAADCQSATQQVANLRYALRATNNTQRADRASSDCADRTPTANLTTIKN